MQMQRPGFVPLPQGHQVFVAPPRQGQPVLVHPTLPPTYTQAAPPQVHLQTAQGYHGPQVVHPHFVQAGPHETLHSAPNFASTRFVRPMSGRRRDLARQVGEAVQLTALGVIASPVPTFQCKICGDPRDILLRMFNMGSLGLVNWTARILSMAAADVFILALKQQANGWTYSSSREQITVLFPAIRTSISVTPETFSELCEFCEKHNRTHVGVLTLNERGSKLQFYQTPGQQWSYGKKSVAEMNVLEHSEDHQFLDSFRQDDGDLVPDRFPSAEHDQAPGYGDIETTVINLAMEGQSRFTEVKDLFGELQRSMQARFPATPGVMADMIAATLPQLAVEDRQQALGPVLDANLIKPRLELVLNLVHQVSQIHQISKNISDQVQQRSSEELRETVLRQSRLGCFIVDRASHSLVSLVLDSSDRWAAYGWINSQLEGRQLLELNREMRKLRDDGRASDSESDEDVHGFADDEGEEDQVATLREALKKAQLSPEAEKIAQRELRRLQNIQPHHPEHSVCRSYLETLAGLPWALSSKDDLDLNTAQSILEKDHYGLEKVKRRILEFLAVQKMRKDMKGPILCLHGPPGVGKTSLGRSVAKALNRKFHRIALGGLRDEAEIRGHRRTYIGSMPGAIMQALATLQVNNPVILLDEIDKLTRNAMFNPSGAMLELLDPEQNHTFKDHYINTPFDLSKVLFLCTCNQLDTIDRPLLDRMEVIELSGYTMEEKVHIATTHLLPKQKRIHGLEKGADDDHPPDAAASGSRPVEAEPAPEPEPRTAPLPELVMTQEAIRELITKWTVESGVRNLERRLAQVCRWAALRLAEKTTPELSEGKLVVAVEHLPSILGAQVFEPDVSERLTVGVAMGLGVSATGGALLFVEASRSKGSGKLTVTGQLGEVMQESVRTAMSLLRSRIYYAAWGSERPRVESPLEPIRLSSDSILSKWARDEHKAQDPFGGDDIHVHFPAGAIPKDGPSAGVATVLALASLLLDRPVRSDTAVTGEITLRGHILPVGGIRDKVLAAHRAGIRHVLVPFGNQRHVFDEIPEAALSDVEVKYVKHIDQALAWAFEEQQEHSFPPSDPKMPRAKL
ncbi:Lon protease (ATP-dependent protease La) [Durusdinium trenchii]|uniref:Lon protease (ATP-dependent protease La) n=1 Tax=Durusdinium trenchii TaxID=1381693 RepID=A0ABP0M892_9DINO